MRLQGMKIVELFGVLMVVLVQVLYGFGAGYSLKVKAIEPFIDNTDVFFEIVHPPELEYTYKIKPAEDFGAPFNASFWETEIPLVPTDPPHGCQISKNAKELKDRVALVERGECSFMIKSIMAEEAGAKAVIIADYPAASMQESIASPLWADHYYVEMIRDNTVPPTKVVNIPAGFLLGKNGRMIRQTLKRLNQPYALINIPVNLTYTPLDKLNQPPWLLW